MHICREFVDVAIYALCLESFCVKNPAVRKVLVFSDSALGVDQKIHPCGRGRIDSVRQSFPADDERMEDLFRIKNYILKLCHHPPS